MKSLLLALAALAAAGCAGTPPSDPERQRLERLDGVYQRLAPEPWYGAYGTRRFVFEDGRWSLAFTFALDPAMTQKVFTFRTKGPYRVLERSAAEPREFEAVFYEDAKFVTWHPQDEALMAQFGMDRCGLKPGVEVDISASGCANWRPVSVCREDHDLFGIDAAGQLLFGARPADNDMCTPERRPTQLLAPVAPI